MHGVNILIINENNYFVFQLYGILEHFIMFVTFLSLSNPRIAYSMHDELNRSGQLLPRTYRGCLRLTGN